MATDDAKDKGDSLLDTVKDQASELAAKGKDLIAEHGDKVADGIDKAAGFADEKTGGKHSDKIDTAAKAAKDAVEKLGGGAADEGPPSKTSP